MRELNLGRRCRRRASPGHQGGEYRRRAPVSWQPTARPYSTRPNQIGSFVSRKGGGEYVDHPGLRPLFRAKSRRENILTWWYHHTMITTTAQANQNIAFILFTIRKPPVCYCQADRSEVIKTFAVAHV